jgi:hypothetical protein
MSRRPGRVQKIGQPNYWSNSGFLFRINSGCLARTSVSPEIELTDAWAVMATSQAAARVLWANAPKYTSSGVA